MKRVTKITALCHKVCTNCGEEYQGTPPTRYCPPCAELGGSYAKNMLIPRWRLKKLLSMAKNRSKTKKLEFDIDLDYLTDLWDEYEGCCALSGVELQLGRAEVGKVHPYAPSLDREIPHLGYTKGNVRIVAYQINVALSEFGVEQFDKMIRSYVQHTNLV